MTTQMETVAKLMADLDLCTLVTRKGDALAGRPMSTNGQVDYDGDSYFFTWADAGMTGDISADPRVALTFQRAPGLVNGPPLFIHVQGRARVQRDKTAFAAHWSEELARWFKQGVDTPGLVMLHVQATRIAYWNGEEEADFAVPGT
ncbi:pyridoxamine 5'-phosphate oxidase family protein [Jannaschia sp. M317]|uniref:pyridoxamine 5'-phosphate oxidase family protein n=1 Tax=Jannaschia sp. M317 TaxID=2867011 RepID=UPI0021A3E035|nr:pyridoxamine 5'-phosphate oxidase family protein [Jannaschia sp. M317]UWQ17985.1 pyridoxamine 5'-phosphate oxidase family protein [Jannaschia sp. M317]